MQPKQGQERAPTSGWTRGGDPIFFHICCSLLQVDSSCFAQLTTERQIYPFNSSTRFLKILFIPLPLSLRLFIDTVESSL